MTSRLETRIPPSGGSCTFTNVGVALRRASPSQAPVNRRRDGSIVCLAPVRARRAAAGPNSTTGSGPLPLKEVGLLREMHSAPETSPCHAQAKQVGELDPRKVTRGCRERSRGIETSTELVIGTRSASAQFVVSFCTWAVSAGSCERKPAAPTRRPIRQ